MPQTKLLAQLKAIKVPHKGIRKIFLEDVKNGDWTSLATGLFATFITLDKADPRRITAKLLWDALPKAIRDTVNRS